MNLFENYHPAFCNKSDGASYINARPVVEYIADCKCTIQRSQIEFDAAGYRRKAKNEIKMQH